MPLSYPLINGARYDFSSIQFLFNGVKRIIGLKEIGYKVTLTPGKVRGTAAQKIGRTRGEFDVDSAYFTIYKEDFDDLTTALVALNAGTSFGTGIASGIQASNLPVAPVGFMEVSFLIMVAYAEAGASLIQSDKLFGCRLTAIDHSYSQGSDPLAVRCDMDVMYALLNNKSPINLLAT